MRQAATILLVRDDGKILAVSRGVGTKNYALPGGKQNIEDKSLADTAIRELNEETGVRAYKVRKIYDRDDGEFYVETFTTDKWFGKIMGSDEGDVMWLEPKELLSEECTFREYNQKVLEKMGLV